MVMSAVPAVMAGANGSDNGAAARPRAFMDNADYLEIPAGDTYWMGGLHKYSKSVKIDGALAVYPNDGVHETTGWLHLVAPSITIGSTGRIYADECGWDGGAGGSRYQNDGGKAGKGAGAGGTGSSSSNGNAGGGGGGGAGYGGKGAPGGYGGDANDHGAQGGAGGSGGPIYGTFDRISLEMGSGGGGGGASGGSGYQSGYYGRKGGGGVWLDGTSVDMKGAIMASGGRGGNGVPSSSWPHGSGGGGGASGGCVVVSGMWVNVTGQIYAVGGQGGDGGSGDGSGSHGHMGAGGGGGGGGVIKFYYAVKNIASGGLSVRAGLAGSGSNHDMPSGNVAGSPGLIVENGRPSAPELVGPDDGATASTLRPTFNWRPSTDPEGNATSYKIQLSTDPAFSTVALEQAGIQGTSFDPGEDLLEDVYYWRVVASDSFGPGLWSPVWKLRTDTVPPESSVLPLGEYQTTASFTVNWSGSDDLIGISGYDVWVSENGGRFLPWLTGTADKGAVFEGRDGQSYGFYSQAVDFAKNLEVAPAAPDAVTTVDITPPISVMEPLPPYENTTEFDIVWSSRDATSGVKDCTVFMSENESGFIPILENVAETSMEFTGKEGSNYTFYVQARDAAGNLEPVPGEEMWTKTRVDSSIPTANISVGTPAYGDRPVYILPGGAITIAAADNSTPVSAFFALDGGTAAKYIGVLKNHAPGSHNISYWSVDMAGNEAARRTLWFFADGEAPSTTLALDGPKWVGASVTYLSNATKIGLSATDFGCGVDRILYSTGPTPVVYSGPFTLNASAVTTLKYWSVDRLGNAEAPRMLSVITDSAPPATTASAPAQAVSDLALVRLSPTDDQSGVADTFYRITPPGGTAQAWQKGTDLVIQAKKDHSADGVHRIEYYSVDRIGNQEPAKSVQVVIDTTVGIELSTTSGLSVKKGNYTLSGRVEPGSSVLVNGRPAQVMADGNFSFTLDLVSGSNMLVVTVTDPAGSTRTVTSEVIYRKPAESKPAETLSMLNLLLIVLLIVMAIIIVVLLLRKRKPTPEPAQPAYAPAPPPWPQPAPPQPYQPAPVPPAAPPPVPPPQAPPQVPPPEMRP